MMAKEKKQKQTDFQFNTEDYVLYILKKIPYEKSTPLVINKIAFLTEFAYKFKTFKDLTDIEYAAIDYGPVINNYKKLFKKMSNEGKIEYIGEKHLSPKQDPQTETPEHIKAVIDQLIEHYSRMDVGELITLTHKTDSYIITTEGQKKIMSNIIDKDLTHLDTIIFGGNELESLPEVDLDALPVINKAELVKYEF